MTLAGAVLGGRYALEEQIGNGGYGEVWRATDTVLARPVAIKLLHPRYAQRSEVLARFRAEARQAGCLSHENIAQVFDYGEPADRQPPYLVMELVDGPSLEAVLAGSPLESSRTMDIVAQAAAGLQAAHAAGMIHRDIKPGNLLLAPGGIVKITDFGIARTIGSAQVTASGELIGTPGYLAPERAEGDQATPASDLYSLGMVAYECLAGAAPFTGTALEVALAHRDRPLPPLPPSVSADVRAFVLRLTAKDPARRLDDAAEVAMWAGLLRDGVGVAALQAWPDPPPGPSAAGPSEPGPPLAVGWLQRRTVLAYACVAVTALVIIVLVSVIGFASTPGPVTASPAPAPMVLRNWREVRPNQRSVVPSSRMPRRAATACEAVLSRSVRASTWPMPASAAAAKIAPAASVANPCPWCRGCRCQPTSVRPVGPLASARGTSGMVPTGVLVRESSGTMAQRPSGGSRARSRSCHRSMRSRASSRVVRTRRGCGPSQRMTSSREYRSKNAGRSGSSQCRSSRRGVRSSSIGAATRGHDVRAAARTGHAGSRACPILSSPRRRRPARRAARRPAPRS